MDSNLTITERLNKISVLTEVLKAAKAVFVTNKDDKDKLVTTTVDMISEELELLKNFK